jgi:hypothetical protein
MTAANSDSDGSIPETHNYTEAVGTRLTPKTKRRLDDYQEREEAGTSEALRRLIRAGLDADADDGTDPLRNRLIEAGLVLFLLGFPTLAAARGATGLAALFIGLWVVIVLAQPLLDRAISRLPNPINWFE